MIEIEEYGLDSITILKAVIAQFQFLFKESPQSQRKRMDYIKGANSINGKYKHLLENMNLNDPNTFTFNRT